MKSALVLALFATVSYTAELTAVVAEPLADVTDKVFFDVNINEQSVGRLVIGLFGIIKCAFHKNY